RLATFCGKFAHKGFLARSSHRGACSNALFAESPRDVLLEEFLELLGNAITRQRDRLLAILINRSHGTLAGSREADPDVGVLALSRPIYDAPHDRHGHILDTIVFPTPFRHP